MSDREWFVITYDAAVAETGDDGAALEKARDVVAHEYAEAVASGAQPRHVADLVEEGRELFDMFIGTERRRRKSSIRDQIAYLLDAFESGEEDGAYVDPILSLAYPLGEHDGRDKILRFWTIEDWQGATTERYRKAAQATAAAAAFDTDTATRVVAAMAAKSARTVGDLFR
jgi:hypothetical protein